MTRVVWFMNGWHCVHWGWHVVLGYDYVPVMCEIEGRYVHCLLTNTYMVCFNLHLTVIQSALKLRSFINNYIKSTIPVSTLVQFCEDAN